MTMRTFTILIAAAALSAGSGAAAQRPPQQRPAVPPECSDDRGVDRCSAEQHRRVLSLYGLAPIERLLEEGAQVRRVFFVDGYGRDLVALNFVRARGGDPAVTVHHPAREGAPPADPMRALLPMAAWRDVLLRSSHFDRRLAPRAEAPRPREEINICLHSWVFTVEAADPDAEGRGAGTRRAVQDACSEGMVAPLATALAEVALPLFPPCAALDPRRHRGAAGQLAGCARLEGDRHAAAEVVNESAVLLDARGPDDLRQLGPHFLEEAVIDWNGERLSGDALAEAWIERTLRPTRTSLYLERYRGESTDRVRARGSLIRRDSDQATSEAPVEITWLRARGFGPRIERITVGAFVPFRPQAPARR
jgi:hypothetical protein